jgi:hypothetical protein
VAAAAAGVLAFGLSEVPEDILDPLAALLYGQHLAWRYRDRRFFYPAFFFTCSANGVWSVGGRVHVIFRELHWQVHGSMFMMG